MPIDEFDDRPRRPDRGDHDQRADYRDPPSRPGKRLSDVGVVSLGIGVGALLLSFVPYIGLFAAIPGGVGLILGAFGLWIARSSKGREGVRIPIAGLSVSAVAVVLAVVWWVLGGIRLEQNRAIVQGWQDQAAERKALEAEQEAAEVRAVETEADPIRITAVNLDSAYHSGEAAADRKYKGMILEIEGDVVAISRIPVRVQLEGARLGYRVDCRFPRDRTGQLDGLVPGQTVTIRGRCAGEEGHVTLKSCVLIKK